MPSGMHRVLLLLLLGTVPCLADITLIQELKNPSNGNQPTVLEMKIKGQKIRSDISKEASVIVDTSTGEVTTLMHQNKIAMKVPKALVDLAEAQAGVSKDLPPPKKTGRTETINGFACEEYVTEQDGRKISIWITQDAGDLEELIKQMDAVSSQANPLGKLFSAQKIKGFPVKTTIDMGTGGEISMTLISLKRDPLPESDFEIPSGYREMAMPMMGQ